MKFKKSLIEKEIQKDNQDVNLGRRNYDQYTVTKKKHKNLFLVIVSVLIVMLMVVGCFALKLLQSSENIDETSEETLTAEAESEPEIDSNINDILFNSFIIGLNTYSDVENMVDVKTKNENSIIENKIKTIDNVNFTPVYIFKNGKLNSIVYESMLDNLQRSNICTLVQSLSAHINKYNEQMAINTEWVGAAREYNAKAWNEAILQNELVFSVLFTNYGKNIKVVAAGTTSNSFISQNGFGCIEIVCSITD